MRGMSTASCAFMSLVDGVDHGLQHAVMMWLPPDVPTTMTGLPSLVTMVGLIEDSGRLLGAMALAMQVRQLVLHAAGNARGPCCEISMVSNQPCSGVAMVVAAGLLGRQRLAQKPAVMPARPVRESAPRR
jgi:hypothetical protein